MVHFIVVIVVFIILLELFEWYEMFQLRNCSGVGRDNELVLKKSIKHAVYYCISSSFIAITCSISHVAFFLIAQAISSSTTIFSECDESEMIQLCSLVFFCFHLQNHVFIHDKQVSHDKNGVIS